MIGKYVVIRTYSAGVHIGVLKSHDGSLATLTDARRVWSWSNANTLHEVANNGVGDGSRVSETVSEIIVNGVIEVIATTFVGEAALRGATWTR